MSKTSGWSLSRRQFLNSLGVASIAASLPSESLASAWDASPTLTTAQAVKNRLPLAANAFYPLPLSSIKPRGWLLSQLQVQANGLSGHLDEIWADVGPNSGWLGGTGESWERGPYFLDGLLPLAYCLDDARLKAKAQKYIDWVLEHQAANGMIGPHSNDDWWPRIVMLKVLTQYQELTGDPRVIPLMDKYFQYQLKELPQRPLRDWGKFRWQDEVLSVIWLYNRTGSEYLLELAKLLHKQGHDWQGQYANFQYTQRVTAQSIKLDEDKGLEDLALSTHGVNNGQAIKAGPVWSVISGSKDDGAAVLTMISELDRYHGLPNGMFSCDEHLAGPDPSQGSELCTVVEYMFSLEQSLAIVGDPSLGDRLEMLAYNALPGTLTDDMWAHQYNQEPNQVECSLHHKPWTTDGPESNLFGLEPNFGCCTANYHQGWPKLTASLFMLSGSQGNQEHDGLVATAYAPCEMKTMIRGTQVHVLEETQYPFHGTIQMIVTPSTPLDFPLQLRIPAWEVGATISVNGHAEPAPAAGSFARVERKWKAGDRVEIVFPMKPRVQRGFHDSISVARGPLVFSYGVGESWVKLRERGKASDWQIFPATEWNYALHIDGPDPSKSIEVVDGSLEGAPFTRDHAPVTMKVKARKIPEWRAEDGVADTLPQSPVASEQPVEIISLIPYAAAKLRITAFPQLKS